MATEALPVLHWLILQGTPPFGLVRATMGQFMTARRLSGRPVAVYRPKLEFYTSWEPGGP